MSKKKISLLLRLVEEKDCDDLFNWRNDKDTRIHFFDNSEIEYKSHCTWFEKAFIDPRIIQFIIQKANGDKIGQVRSNQQNEMATISISLIPRETSQGMGSQALELACESVFRTSKLEYLVAKIKKDNTKSIKAFQKARFKIFKVYKDHIELRRSRDGK